MIHFCPVLDVSGTSFATASAKSLTVKPRVVLADRVSATILIRAILPTMA